MMIFFNKKYTYHNILLKHYKNIVRILKQYCKNYLDEFAYSDLLSLLYVIVDVYFWQLDATRRQEVVIGCFDKEIIKLCNENPEYEEKFYKRVDFYSSFVTGERFPIFNCCITMEKSLTIDFANKSVLFRLLVAFFDCLINSSCRDDYDNAKFIIPTNNLLLLIPNCIIPEMVQEIISLKKELI